MPGVPVIKLTPVPLPVIVVVMVPLLLAPIVQPEVLPLSKPIFVSVHCAKAPVDIRAATVAAIIVFFIIRSSHLRFAPGANII